MSDLKKCAVRIATTKVSPPFIFVKTAENGTITKIYGRDINLINTLSQIMNFKIDYVYIGIDGFLFENGKADGPFKYLLENKADLIIGDYWLTLARLKHFDATFPYLSSKVGIIVPPCAPISSYELLLMPFDSATWIAIVITTIVSSICVFGIWKFFKIEKYLSFMNLIGAILGESQKTLPKRSFVRILLVKFLIFWLILRTVYQARFYHLMDSNLLRKPMKTIEDLAKNNMTLYYPEALYDFMQWTTLKVR